MSTSLRIHVFSGPAELGEAAAQEAADILRKAIGEKGSARIITATGNSQLETASSLVRIPGIDWSRVEMFHLDEYVGMSAEHPASFRKWIRTRLADVLKPGAIHYLQGDAPDPDEEALRYGKLLDSAPIDFSFIGIGENGHIAFNDPPVADFNDPLTVRRAPLDEACRRQQVGEGHFDSLEEVPKEALTVSCSALMRVKHWICSVPEQRKAEAVRRSLEGPVTTECPASIIQRHPSASLYLDRDSASMLSPETLSASR